jgi:hypothetical protein
VTSPGYALTAEPPRLDRDGRCRRTAVRCCARTGRRDGSDPADPHVRRPVLEGNAGDDLEDDLRKSDPMENVWHKKVCNGTLTLQAGAEG